MNPPLAYLLTWTCSGTWLHGDARGSVDDEHFTPGTDFAPPDSARERGNRKQLSGDPNVLGSLEQEAVGRIIRAHCDHRGWWLGAVSVRSNHVHCVVVAPETKLGTVV